MNGPKQWKIGITLKEKKMNKVQKLVNSIQRVITNVGNSGIKSEVGDSVSNNRTVTVGQLVRFLNNSASGRRRGLGNQVSTVYASRSVKSLIRAARSTSNRTDAVDATELLLALRTAAAVPTLSRSLGRSL